METYRNCFLKSYPDFGQGHIGYSLNHVAFYIGTLFPSKKWTSQILSYLSRDVIVSLGERYWIHKLLTLLSVLSSLWDYRECFF